MGESPVAKEPLDDDREARERVGHTLAGKYKLERLIGSGGMAHVFRATNTVIGRTVAIKVLRSQYARSPETVERFLREARTANLVRHPNVVDVIDFGTDADGASFIVQELLEGETLFAYANRRNGIVPLNELGEIMTPVLSAVAEAHSNGIVHRDLKPENIFLAQQHGRRVPKILDFGISKVLGTDMTAAGMMLGTPAYMAPELAKSATTAGPRSDMWAIGIMLFEVITGRIPFEGANIGELFYAISTIDAARLADVRPDAPPGLSRLVERCLRRDPTERYATVTELAADLSAALESVKPASLKPYGVPPSGHEVTLLGPGTSPSGGGLASRLASRSGVAPLPPLPLPVMPESGTHAVHLATSRRGSSSSRVARDSEPGLPATQRSAERTTHGRRRSRNTPRMRSAPRRPLAWTDVLAVLGVGVLLAVAILAIFRLAR